MSERDHAALRRGAQREALLALFQRFGLYVFFVLLVIVAASISPHFLSGKNLQDVLIQMAPLGVVVIGQTFVILVAGLDLSVGSLMATVAVMATAFQTTDDAMIAPIFVLALLLGSAVGYVNGWLVTKRGVSPFLATLAMMIVLQGVRFAYTQGAPSGLLPPGFRVIGTGTVGGVPVSLIFLAIAALVFGVLLHRTVFGRRIYLVGTNPKAAFLSGINTDLVTTLCYVICGGLAGLAGMLLVGYVGTVDNWVGRGYELDSIAAAVMGGAALSGGRGTILGSIVGALILIVIFNIVVLVGLPVQFQLIVKGVIIVLAAAFYLNSRQS